MICFVRYILLITGFLLFFTHWALAYRIPAEGDPSRRVFALIIGVADYKDKDINDLQFSANDALAFYQYLTGKAGGNVDTANIRLLVNQMATVANIYNAKNWLEKTVRKNDLVYIYFAGHGDRESSIFRLGFLLAYDTPHKNYLNNALRIEDFNDMATTLSVRLGAEVIIVTDACHSGTLSGIDKVHQSSLVQEQLAIARQNEVRIASCLPDQLSQENEVWGGGRGLFSFYLLNGLKGLADKDGDRKVSLDELKNYVQTQVQDQVQTFDLEDQTPVIEGPETRPMSTVIDSVKQLASDMVGKVGGNFVAVSRSVSGLDVMTAARKFLLPLTQENLLSGYDFFKLRAAGKDAFFDQVIRENRFNQEMASGPYAQEIRKDPKKKDELRQELAVIIHDEVQGLINTYLAGDEAKMEERRYYNSNLGGYDEVVPMIEVAMGLLETDHPLYRLLEIKKYYFAGVNARLKTPVSDNPQKLLKTALAHQQKAHDLEPKAAYINNELGVLHLHMGNNKKAIEYFEKATQLSSKWAIPYANLSAAFTGIKDNDKALWYAIKAKEMKPDLELAQYNLGKAYLDKGNLLLAEEAFRKSIHMNNRHFYPYEMLGQVYAAMDEYTRADSFFLRKCTEKT